MTDNINTSIVKREVISPHTSLVEIEILPDLSVVKQEIPAFEDEEAEANPISVVKEEFDVEDNCSMLKTVSPDTSWIKQESITSRTREKQIPKNEKGYPRSDISNNAEGLLISPKREVLDTIDQADIDVSVLHEEVDLGASALGDEADCKPRGLAGCGVNPHYSACSDAALRKDGYGIHNSGPSPLEIKLKIEEKHQTGAGRSSHSLVDKRLKGISDSKLHPVVMLTPLLITNLQTKCELFVCDKCKYTFMSKDSLVQHSKNCRIHYNNRETAFQCTEDMELKVSENSKESNCAKTHKEKRHACNLCDFKCTNKYNVQTHIRTHTGDKPYTCNVCDFKCSNRSTLQRHFRTHTGEKPYICDVCDFKCSERTTLLRHFRTHTGEKPYACNLCDFKCAHKSNLQSHFKTHTGDKPYTCNVCDLKCSTKTTLRRHIRTHTGEKPYACSFCDFKCAVISTLHIHVRIHTGEKPYSCNQCDFKCSTNSSLRRHLRIHTGEKPYGCDVCDFRCADKGHLKTHLRTHTGEKPHACSFCDFRFNHKSHLKNHIRTHTREKPYACKCCDYKSSFKSGLKKHLRTHTVDY